MVNKNTHKNYDLRIKCRNCCDFTKTNSPIKIYKYKQNCFQITGVCSICNKLKNKKANSEQVSLFPLEIKEAPNESMFIDTYKTKEGGVIQILPLIAAILSGVTALSSTAGAVTSNILLAKKNNADEQVNRERLELEKKSLTESERVTRLGSGVSNPNFVRRTESDVIKVPKQFNVEKAIAKLEGNGFKVYKL